MLDELRQFVADEHQAAIDEILAVWERPLEEKLENGKTQAFCRLSNGPEKDTVWAFLEENSESRFREGDMLCLHAGTPPEGRFLSKLTLQEEQDERWLLSGINLSPLAWEPYANKRCYGDPDMVDLSGYFERAIDEVAASANGRTIILPLLAGNLKADDINAADYDHAADEAEKAGFNENQIDAVGWALGARYLACIQGPPGTGKTRVLSLIARLLVERGERVLVTSHTHMAINNALNKIFDQKIPVIKVGRCASNKGLRREVEQFEKFAEWENRPGLGGYAVGATPFATCTSRLENYDFDTVIFDEASQVTLPLAVMAMRNAKRFIFVGDHKQLPPVVLSRSVLDKRSPSVFAQLLSGDRENIVRLDTTYRMNQQLTGWPSKRYYDGKLRATGVNAGRRFQLSHPPVSLQEILCNSNSLVFVKSRQSGARSSNKRDAELISDICREAVSCGLASNDIGIVAPFRNQGRKIRNLLARSLGKSAARLVVADTVERMQGQEREMVIFSVTATDPQYLNLLASFIFQPQRVNVSITRAMTKLIIIGPDAEGLFLHENETVMNWIADYKDLVSQCDHIIL